MNDQNHPQVQSKQGIGFLGGLTLLFIGLKLGKVITWSWWMVLSPLWGPFALVLGLAVLGFFVAAVCGGTASVLRRFKRK